MWWECMRRELWGVEIRKGEDGEVGMTVFPENSRTLRIFREISRNTTSSGFLQTVLHTTSNDPSFECPSSTIRADLSECGFSAYSRCAPIFIIIHHYSSLFIIIPHQHKPVDTRTTIDAAYHHSHVLPYQLPLTRIHRHCRFPSSTRRIGRR